MIARPLGYLRGKLPFIPTQRFIERRFKQTEKFLEEFQSEIGGKAVQPDEEASRDGETDALEPGGGEGND